MTMESKPILRIFVSHRDIAECTSLMGAYNVIKEEVLKINSSGPQRHQIEIELQDYQIDRDLSNPNNGTFQSADTLKKDAAQAHAIFILVEGKDGKDANISERIEKWYHKNIRIVQVEEKENQVPIPIFWNISDDKSKENCENFHKSDSCDKIIKYNSLEKLRSEVAILLFELTGRWASRIHGRQSVPTLDSIIKKRRKKLFLFSVAIFFLLLCILLYFSYPKIQHLRPADKTQEPSVEQVDSTKTIFNNRIINDSLMVDHNHSTPNNNVTSTTIQDSEPGSEVEQNQKPEQTKKPKHGITSLANPPANSIITPNTFVVKADNSSIRINVKNGIREKMPFVVPCQEGENPRWIIKVEVDTSREEVFKKVFENQWDKVKIGLVITINDKTGIIMPIDTIINSIGESPSGIDAARSKAIDSSTSKIIEFASHYIK